MTNLISLFVIDFVFLVQFNLFVSLSLCFCFTDDFVYYFTAKSFVSSYTLCKSLIQFGLFVNVFVYHIDGVLWQSRGER